MSAEGPSKSTSPSITAEVRDRRSFLKSGLSAAALVGAGALGLSACSGGESGGDGGGDGPSTDEPFADGPPSADGGADLPLPDGPLTDTLGADTISSDQGPCQPPGPVKANHLELCRLRHDPQNPQHLSALRPDPAKATTVRLLCRKGDAQRATVEVWQRWRGERIEVPMSLEGSTGDDDRYVATLPATAQPLYYRFRVEDGSAKAYLLRDGAVSASSAPAKRDFSLAPQVSGKVLRYATTFTQPQLMLEGPAAPQAVPMTKEPQSGLWVAKGVGALGQAASFYLEDKATAGQDRPPGGGSYYLWPDLDEAWLEKGTLFDVDPKSVDLTMIDAHTHPYGNSFAYDTTPLTTLLPQQKIGGAITMVSGSPSSQQQKMRALHKSHRWILPLVWISPNSHTAAQVEPLLKSGEFHGLKFHPSVHNYPADGPKMDPFLQLAKTYRVPIQIHSATDNNATTARVIALAKRHPDVPVVMVHTELGTINKTSVIQAIKSVPNIYAETSWTNPQMIKHAMDVLDSSRTIFGTDATVDGMQQFTKTSIANPQGAYVYTIPAVIAEVKQSAHPDAFANWARLTAIRLYRWRFRPDAELLDTDGDGIPDVSDADLDGDGVANAADSAPQDPSRG